MRIFEISAWEPDDERITEEGTYDPGRVRCFSVPSVRVPRLYLNKLKDLVVLRAFREKFPQ